MIGGAYILVVVGILLAKGLGFVRDMVFAGAFGTATASDIYFQVFGLVNLIFTGLGVALSTLVIKNLNKAENHGKEIGYAASFLRKSCLWMTVCAALVALCAKPIVKLILPNLTGADFDLAVRMMYIMSPSLIFVVLAYIISGLLQNKQVYFITSVMSLPFNVAIILSLLPGDVSITTVGVVTTIGWFLHIVIQLPAFFKNGYSITASGSKQASTHKSPEILWIFVSNMMFQLCVYIDRAFVSESEGMASTFNYASNLFITIASVFVVAMSTVVFPSISKNYEEGHMDYVKELVQYIISIMVAIFLPFILVVACFGGDVIRLVYERGEFTSHDTLAVSLIFLLYTLGALGYVAQELLNKVLYLAGKYKNTVIATVSVVVLNLGLNYVMDFFFADQTAFGMSLSAILSAASTALLMNLYAVVIALSMKKVIGNYFTASLFLDLGKILLSGLAAAVVYFIFDRLIPEITHGYISFLIPLCACGIAYGAMLLGTGMVKKLLKREKKEVQS